MSLKIDWSGRSHFYTKKEKDYLLKIIDKSDVLTHGPELDRFETGLKNYLKVNNIFVLNSAASALELIAELLSLKKGDEVIVPAHTYCASAIAFARNGAKIIWADLDLKTRTINFEDVKNKITKKTKAVVIVHLYGYAVDVEPFIKIARKKKIKIIEDCAQAFGAEIKKKKVGTLGDFSCYSFHAQKNFTTLGEGGAIYVKNNSLAKKIKGLRHNGHRNFKSKRKYYWLPAMGNLELDLKKDVIYNNI
jgi:dTDP-4-amino-4,6-dideoxygalactose transaminase